MRLGQNDSPPGPELRSLVSAMGDAVLCLGLIGENAEPMVGLRWRVIRDYGMVVIKFRGDG